MLYNVKIVTMYMHNTSADFIDPNHDNFSGPELADSFGKGLSGAKKIADLLTGNCGVGIGAKPKRGMWCAAKDTTEIATDWIEFISSDNGKGIPIGSNNFEIKLSKEALIAKLSSQESLEEFENKYGLSDNQTGKIISIDWEKVAKDYHGVEISDNIIMKNKSEKSDWLYGYDISSLVVWDSKAIDFSAIQRLPSTETLLKNILKSEEMQPQEAENQFSWRDYVTSRSCNNLGAEPVRK